jgi:phage/plasmid-like protein (TIGR03299 family)
VVEAGEVSSRFEKVESHVNVTRSDTGASLGVVTNTYEPIGNSEMYDIAEALENGNPDSVRYETGGSLKGGAKVWLLMRLQEPLLVKGDPQGETIPYFALQNAHDGSGACRGQGLNTRIVCDNTSQMADMDAKARGTEFMFRHVSGVQDRIDQAREALAGWRDSIEDWQRLNDHLIGVSINDTQRRAFVNQFVPMPPEHAISDFVVRNVELARESINTILDSQTCDGINNTAYGLVQASVEYNSHVRRAANKETRFKRAYLDRSRVTADAVKLAQEAALV